MKLFERVSQLMTANLNHLLDQAADPEVMIKQLIRDMEESIVELRRETVGAVAREKKLKKQLAGAEAQATQLEAKAALALDHGKDGLAREILARKLAALKQRDTLSQQLDGASQLASRLTSDLLQMEDQVGRARSKKEELIRRQRAAEAQKRMQEVARRSADAVISASGNLNGAAASGSAFDAYADAITTMESEAEAALELSARPKDAEQELQELTKESELDREMERLRRQRTATA